MAVLQACETIKERLSKFHAGLAEAAPGSADAELKTKLDALQSDTSVSNDAYFKAVVHAVCTERRL